MGEKDHKAKIEARLRKAPDGCLVWTGPLDKDGYGRMAYDGTTRLVHRIYYALTVGPFPKNLTLDHLCRNRACCNPAHLEPVTTQVNILRGTGAPARNRRKTHCLRGHPFNEANTYLYPQESGALGRLCRECRKICEAQRRAAARERLNAAQQGA